MWLTVSQDAHVHGHNSVGDQCANTEEICEDVNITQERQQSGKSSKQGQRDYWNLRGRKGIRGQPGKEERNESK